MKTLTHNQFVALVSGLPGTVIMGIETLTDARALKTGNPFPDKTILKHSRVVVMVGADYQNGVNNEGLRQGVANPSFVASGLPYGEWLVPNKFIQHKGAIQIRTQSAPGKRQNQPARILAYRDTSGKFLSRDAVAPFLPVKSASVKQAAAGLSQHAEKQVHVNNYKLDSILKVRVNGQSYKLVAG